MIQSTNFFLLRSPLQSIEHIFQLFLTDDESSLNLENLLNEFSSDILKEALFTASPVFYEQLLKLKSETITNKKEREKIHKVLYKYLSRMCSRATPYGLFAGCSLGTIGNDPTEIIVSEIETHDKFSRLDMNYIGELCHYLKNNPIIKKNLKFYPNNSLYRIGDKYRYVEYSIGDKKRMYHLSEVSASEYLDRIILNSNQGASIEFLADTLTVFDIDFQEATTFVEELIDNQILVSEIEPAIVGEDFFCLLISKMYSIPGAEDLVGKLKEIEGLLNMKDFGVKKLYLVKELLASILPSTTSKDLIQTDLFLQTKRNNINTSVINSVSSSIQKLFFLNNINKKSDFEKFKTSFLERYEMEEIQLIKVLDPETGIGYGTQIGTAIDHSPLIDDINIKLNDSEPTVWNKLKRLQNNKLLNAYKNNDYEILLSEQDFGELDWKEDLSLIPDSFYVHGSVISDENGQVDNERFNFLLLSCNGPSGANLLGRFCYGSKLLTENLIEYLKEEESFFPESIFAEIVHLPQDRVGNILIRPRLRKHEIHYLGNSDNSPENIISITDLFISSRNNEIILRSKSLNKRVFPRLSTAHNFSYGSLSVYQFLCDLQFQGHISGIFWDWNINSTQLFLPRVKYKNIIISRATWNLNKKLFNNLNIPNSLTYKQFFKEYFKKIGIPRFVVISEADNELLIDIEQEICLKILADELKKKENVRIVEYLSMPSNCFVNGSAGKFTNEIVFPMKKSKEEGKTYFTNIEQYKEVKLNRLFSPGSEWLYIKIYCGISLMDVILSDIIRPFVIEILENKIIDKWFFIRFFDPENHIRLRLHFTSALHISECLNNISTLINPYLKTREITKLTFDTYKREIERYGENSIELSESIFFQDSVAVISFISLLEGTDGEKFRWLFGLKGIDYLLDDFNIGLEEKYSFLSILQASFTKEFGNSPRLIHLLNDKYRNSMKDINDFLGEDHLLNSDNSLQEHNSDEEAKKIANEILNVRSVNSSNTIIEILRVKEKNNSAIQNLLASYIHMFLNRLFKSNQRKHELVVYHYLKKYYESKLIRQKKLQK